MARQPVNPWWVVGPLLLFIWLRWMWPCFTDVGIPDKSPPDGYMWARVRVPGQLRGRPVSAIVLIRAKVDTSWVLEHGIPKRRLKD